MPDFIPITDHGLPPTVVVVVHDVAPPLWPACQRLMAAIADCGDVPLSLLAVPQYHGAARDVAFEHWLLQRQALGDEIVLHGFRHWDDGQPAGLVDRLRRQHYTRSEGEFSALGLQDAQTRLDAGLVWLASLGVAPQGFVAPAWLASDASWRALQSSPLRYSCTVSRFMLLPGLQALRCQAQVWSDQTAWRRGASVLWNAALGRWNARQPVLRIELHPTDADHPSTRQSWQRLLRAALAGQRQAATLAQLADSLRQRQPVHPQSPGGHAAGLQKAQRHM